MEIKVKYLFDEPEGIDGVRILVEKGLPEGFDPDELKVDLLYDHLAPSDELDFWFNHEPDRWEEFKHRYAEELAAKNVYLAEIIDRLNRQGVTLLYVRGNKDMNYALALKEYIEKEYFAVEEFET